MVSRRHGDELGRVDYVDTTFLGADATAPTSSVAALPASSSTPFNVSWSGSDGGALPTGVASYDIYVKDNSAAYSLWLSQTTQTASSYPGVAGHTYAFYSQARDHAGNVEAAPASADAQTVVADNTPPGVSSAGFEYELAQAIAVVFDEAINPSSINLARITATAQPSGPTFNPTAVSYDAPTRKATFTFASLLPDAHYQASVLSGVATDPAGNAVAVSTPFTFFVLAGDADHDGKVNVTDLGTLASNYGGSSKTFSQGDFNYDSKIDVTDLGNLASNYGVDFNSAGNAFTARTAVPTAPAAKSMAQPAAPTPNPPRPLHLRRRDGLKDIVPE